MLLSVLLLLILGAAVLVVVAAWASKKSPAVRDVIAFCLAGGSAYSLGFTLNMWVLAATGDIPAGNFAWTTFTWLVIAFACLVAAFQTGASPPAFAIAFLLSALLAAVFASSVREVLFIAVPLFVGGICINLYRRRFVVRRKVPTRRCFPIGPYRVGDSTEKCIGLVEFSPEEYVAMGGRQFEAEKNYDAQPTSFLGRTWSVQLQSVDGQICKIATSLILRNKQDANQIAMQTLQFCRDELGQPAVQKAGLFLWDATDGNIILLTREVGDGLVISLSITSRSIRDFERL